MRTPKEEEKKNVSVVCEMRSVENEYHVDIRRTYLQAYYCGRTTITKSKIIMQTKSLNPKLSCKPNHYLKIHLFCSKVTKTGTMTCYDIRFKYIGFLS